mmetsp:Transcript_108535/g.263873  ORF Transcript_108535/g.263873 Transcript_108535/m.263873 type:complete len:459 (+) Transcript_108535:109-1485(+)
MHPPEERGGASARARDAPTSVRAAPAAPATSAAGQRARPARRAPLTGLKGAPWDLLAPHGLPGARLPRGGPPGRGSGPALAGGLRARRDREARLRVRGAGRLAARAPEELLLDGHLGVVVVVRPELVVDVHEAALHLLEHLDLVLQRDAGVVALAERGLLGHHDLELHEVLGAEVVGVELVQLHARVVLLGELHDFPQEVGVCPLAHDHLHLLEASSEPGVHDVHGDGDARQGVHDPELRAQMNGKWRKERREVGDHVVRVVLRDGLDGVVLRMAGGHSPAPEEQHALQKDDHDEQHHCALGEHDGGYVIRAPVSQQPHHGGADHLDGGHTHDNRADHDTYGLQPAPAHRVLLRLSSRGKQAGPHQRPLAKQVDGRVDQRGKDCQGAGAQKGVDLRAKEHKVDPNRGPEHKHNLGVKTKVTAGGDAIEASPVCVDHLLAAVRAVNRHSHALARTQQRL